MKNDFIANLFLNEFFAVLCVRVCVFVYVCKKWCTKLRWASDDPNGRRRFSTAFTLYGNAEKIIWINQVVMRWSFAVVVAAVLYQFIDWCQTRISPVDSDIKFYDGIAQTIHKSTATAPDCESKPFFLLSNCGHLKSEPIFSLLLSRIHLQMEQHGWIARIGRTKYTQCS